VGEGEPTDSLLGKSQCGGLADEIPPDRVLHYFLDRDRVRHRHIDTTILPDREMDAIASKRQS